MTHVKPIHMVITTLYQNDVQFGDKRIPFKNGKMHNKIILRIYCTVLSSFLSGSKLLLTFKQNNICSNGTY